MDISNTNSEIKSWQALLEFLRQARIKAGLSQNAVARMLGLQSGQFISNIERGVAFPPANKIVSYSKILKVDSEILYSLLKEEKFNAFKAKTPKKAPAAGNIIQIDRVDFSDHDDLWDKIIIKYNKSKPPTRQLARKILCDILQIDGNNAQ